MYKCERLDVDSNQNWRPSGYNDQEITLTRFGINTPVKTTIKIPVGMAETSQPFIIGGLGILEYNKKIILKANEHIEIRFDNIVKKPYTKSGEEIYCEKNLSNFNQEKIIENSAECLIYYNIET